MFYRIISVFLLIANVAIADIDVENNLSEKFKIGGYIDAGFTEFGIYNAIPSREFAIRRSGFELNAEIVENLKAEIKYEVRPDDSFLKDAVVIWEPVNWSRARAGQFKKQTLLGGAISSWDLGMFDRPLVYDFSENLTYAGRDLGIDLRIDLPEFSGIELRGNAGVFNGDERGNERSDDELLYTFRGELSIPSVDLVLGTSLASHRQGQEASEEPSGYAVSARQNAFSADLSLDYKISNWYNLSLVGEMAIGDNWSLVDVVAGEEAPSFKAYWGTFTAFYHPWRVSGIETVSLAVSYDYLEADTELNSHHRRLSIIGSVFPTENVRIRFGGISNHVSELISEEDYTDFIVEAGFRF